MKIYIDKQVTEDLSKYSDEELKLWGIYSREHAQLPIAISDFNLDLNPDGYAILTFKTDNHKYLDIQYRTSSSRRVDEDYKNKPWSSQGIEISTHEEFKGGDYGDGKAMMLPVSRLMIWLEPDTLAEKEAIDGMMCVIATKWQYEMIIVPYGKFYSDSESKFDPIDKFEDDLVYSSDLF
jgi:hypothetical protein